jgi:hypothetical protein
MSGENYKSILYNDIKELKKIKAYLKMEGWLRDERMNENIINYFQEDIMKIIQEEIDLTYDLIEFENRKKRKER